jgi:hypothetical protein
MVSAERVYMVSSMGGQGCCVVLKAGGRQHTDTSSSDCRCHGNILKQMVIRSAS